MRAEVRGSRILEMKDNTQAVSNELTFQNAIDGVDIWHNENGLLTFVVNGVSLKVARGGWRSLVGGVPSNVVTIPAGVVCTVGRCE
jgi:hypothetical protein